MAIKSNEKTKEFFNIKNISREQISTGLHDQGYKFKQKKTTVQNTIHR